MVRLSSRSRSWRPLLFCILVLACFFASTGGGRAPVPAPAPAVPPTPPPAAPPAAQGAARDPGAMMQSGAAVYVDDSFASVEKLRNAIRFASQGQPQQAITTYQEIIDQFGQKLVYLSDNSYLSITDYVRERLLQMPAVKSGMYDQLFGGSAARDIDAAIDNRDLTALIRTGDRYFPSSAAFRGLSHAAEWYFERGEFSAAARLWQELLTHPKAGGDKAQLLFRAAAAQHLAGSDAVAKSLRDRLSSEFPDATGEISGKKVRLLTRLDELFSMAPWEKVELAGDEWPAFGGGPSHSRLLNTKASIGARLWSLTFSDDSPAAPPSVADIQRQQMIFQAQMGIGRISMSPDGAALTSHPVLSNGTLFIDAGERIIAISANAGTKLWSYPAEMPAPEITINRNLRNRYEIYAAMSAHDSAAVFGDQVFAILPARQAPPGALRGDPRIYGLSQPATRLVCINRDSGSEIWTRNAEEIRLDKEGTLSFVGAPLVSRQGVFVLARKMSDLSFVQQYLVRLDRLTGEITWTCYLCSTSSGLNGSVSPYLAMASVTLPTLVDDVLYICTGQGADCAVDANVGRILWLRVAPDTREARAPSPTFMLPSWKLNPPVITGDFMIASDSDAFLRVYNRWSGALLNTISSADYGITRIDVVAGVAANRLIFTGTGDEGGAADRTVALDVSTLDQPQPRIGWKNDVSTTSSGGAGKPLGRPFLSATGYYVPFEQLLVRFDVQSGLLEKWDWPHNEKDESGKPGNLLVTPEQVVVVNDSEIAGYSKWETALSNRQTFINSHPEDPEGYLALAEISFRTAHLDLAAENMKKSVDLAIGKGGGGADSVSGKSAPEILQRLYRTNLNFAEQLLARDDRELRDRARFYFEQCRAAAREPEQQAQWRMRLAELTHIQQKPDEEAQLLSQVLADPTIRAAGYRDRDILQSAGSAAEQRLRDLIKSHPDAYRRFEDQAATLTQRATTAGDSAVLQQVIDSFPNSKASLTAATSLAALAQDRRDWPTARRALWWLVPRLEADPPAQARAIAGLATAGIGLKKYQSAAAWAARGERLFKDFSWQADPSLGAGGAGGGTISFKDLRSRIIALGGADLDGRLPIWKPSLPPPLSTEQPPLMAGLPFSAQNLIADGSQLLLPLESALSLRRPNLVFIRKDNSLSIFDTASPGTLGEGIPLPPAPDAVLVGVSGDTALLVQPGNVIGVDLRSRKTWTRPLPPPQPARPGIQQPPNLGGRQLQIQGNARVEIVNGMTLVDGIVVGPDGSVILLNADTGERILAGSTSDPEVIRNSAFARIGQPGISARILDGKLILAANGQLDACRLADGKPAWLDRSGNPVSARLPDGRLTAVIGNDDLIVVQIDAPTGKSSTLVCLDADSGNVRKTFKVNDRPVWRALGDDGTLYLISDVDVSAIDLYSDTPSRWVNSGLGSRFAGAAQVTLDALICVTDQHNVISFSLGTGDQLAPALDLIAGTGKGISTGTINSLRSWIDGDSILFLTSEYSALYRKYQPDAPRRMEPLTIPTQPPPPPLQSLQLSDSYIIELAAGPAADPRSTAKLLFYERKTGKLKDAKDILGAPGEAVTRQLRSWLVVDNGIVFADARGALYYWRTRQ